MFSWYRDFTSVITKEYVAPKTWASIAPTLLIVYSLEPSKSHHKWWGYG